MADWGPVVIVVVLFVLLTLGLLLQLPWNSRAVEFNNMQTNEVSILVRAVEFNNIQTNGVSILVHTIINFGLITIFLIAIDVHISTG